MIQRFFQSGALLFLLFNAVTAQDSLSETIQKHYRSGQYDSVCIVYDRLIQDGALQSHEYTLQVCVAKSYYYTDRNRQSLELYKRIYDFPSEDSVIFLRMLIDYALVLTETGQYETARTVLSRAGALVGQYGSRTDLGRWHNRYGVYYLRQGEYGKSLSRLDSAKAVADELMDADLLSSVYTNYGIVYRETGQYGKAVKIYRLAARIDSISGKAHDLAVDYVNIANAYNELGLYRKSMDYYRLAAETYSRLNDTAGLSLVYGNLGTVHYDIGEYKSSAECMEKSLKLNKGDDSLGYASALLNLGIAYQMAGRAEESVSLLWDARRRFIRLSRKTEEAYSLNYTGRARLMLDQVDEAEKAFLSAIEIFESSEVPQLGWIAYYDYARLKFQAGKTDSAVVLLERSVQMIEGLRAGTEDESLLTHFMENEIQQAYRMNVYLNILIGRYSSAFRIFEKSRVRSLKRYEFSMERSSGDVQFIEYFLYDTLWFAFVTGSDTIQVRFLSASNSVISRIRDYYHLIRSENIDSRIIKKASHKLYEFLLLPLTDLLSAEIPLIIVPDGPLYYLPFETLWTGEQYLIEKFAVSYVPSADYYEQLKERRRMREGDHSRSVYFFKSDYSDMDCDIGGLPLEKLPFIENEKNTLMKFIRLDSTNAFLYTGGESSLKNFGNRELGILHIAAHGINNLLLPEQSALVTGAGGHAPDDGYLTAEEIIRHRISANLVVLSACETSLGELLWGEGMIGLTRAFLQSGSSAVISTLWKIRDSAAANFIDRFYNYKLVNKMDSRASLKNAKIDMIRSGKSHPFYWGAFVLWGCP